MGTWQEMAKVSLWVFIVMVSDASAVGYRQLAGLWLLSPHSTGIYMACMCTLKLVIQSVLLREVFLVHTEYSLFTAFFFLKYCLRTSSIITAST